MKYTIKETLDGKPVGNYTIYEPGDADALKTFLKLYVERRGRRKDRQRRTLELSRDNYAADGRWLVCRHTFKTPTVQLALS